MQKKELQISTELEKIFDAMTFDIPCVITELNGISTITMQSNDTIIFDDLGNSMRLQNGMSVSIGLKNYEVSNVIHTPIEDTFTVEGINITSETSWKVACNFQVGTRKEVNQILAQEQNDDNKFKRFPLVWWIYSDEKDSNHRVLDFKSTLNFAFAYKSNSTDRTKKRIENNFTKIIQPLLKLFKLWLQSSDFNYMLDFYGYEKPIDCKEINWPYYGEDNGGVLETTSDAIEVEFNLDFKRQYEY